jgi:DNA-binding CsgD family transcriptional regulator
MPGVFGRDEELRLGDAFLADARERFSALALEGEAGVGKTTVWAEVVRRADDAGFRVLSCRPAETETKFALSALADLLEGVPDSALDALPELQRRALEVALLRAEATGEAAQPRTLSTAVRSLLGELSAGRPLLVAVDDVQWLDNASAVVLEFAIRRLQSVPGGWLFARRVGVPCRLTVENLVSADALVQSAVGPLTVAALHHILKDRLGQTLTRSALVRVHAISGGNPFYALEVARELVRADPGVGGAVPVPDSIRDVLSRRLRRLPAETRRALLTAAAVSDPTTALVDENALVAAEEDDIVTIDDDGHITFRHPLYASAVYGSASRSARRELHARLAELVTDAEERARHLAAAATTPSEEIAVALEDGAVVARSRGAWGSAADLLEQAATLTAAERVDGAHRRRIAAAEHHIRAGDRPRARAVLEAVLDESPSRERRADALRLLGEVSYNDENVNEALRAYQQALDCTDDPRTANIIELGLAYAYSILWDFDSAYPHTRRALERAESSEGQPLLAEALAYCAIFDWNTGRGIPWDLVERSLVLEDHDSLLPVAWRPSLIAGLLCLYSGRHVEGRVRLRAVWAEATERGDESDVAFVGLWLSWLETRAGNLTTALEIANDALALATATGGQTTGAWALSQRAYVQALRGDISEARKDVADAVVQLDRFDFVLARLWIGAALGALELSLGDPDSAWRACEPLVVVVETTGIGEPVPLFFLPDALEALIAGAHLERAEALIKQLEDRGRELEREWAVATGARTRALLLAARGDVPGAAAAVDHALAALEGADFPYERARTLLVSGVLERRQRRRAQAKARFEEAHAVFEQVGARLWAQRAAAEIDRLGLRRGAGDELTPSEQRVAELVATGMSNREVAAALSVSPKTVEASLARVYRKLGIASRAELGARMADFLQK